MIFSYLKSSIDLYFISKHHSLRLYTVHIIGLRGLLFSFHYCYIGLAKYGFSLSNFNGSFSELSQRGLIEFLMHTYCTRIIPTDLCQEQ